MSGLIKTHAWVFMKSMDNKGVAVLDSEESELSMSLSADARAELREYVARMPRTELFELVWADDSPAISKGVAETLAEEAMRGAKALVRALAAWLIEQEILALARATG